MSEDGLLTIVTVGPVVPHPATRLTRHVCSVLLLQYAVEIESCEVFRPVDPVFV